MTVVDSRTVRQPTAATRAASLSPVEPGLNTAITLRITTGIVAIGTVISIVITQNNGQGLKLAFILACLASTLLGRPSALRAVLTLLPIAWIIGLGITEIGLMKQAGTALSLKEIALESGQAMVLWAPWLWVGWLIALAAVFSRGALLRR